MQYNLHIGNRGKRDGIEDVFEIISNKGLTCLTDKNFGSDANIQSSVFTLRYFNPISTHENFKLERSEIYT